MMIRSIALRSLRSTSAKTSSFRVASTSSNSSNLSYSERQDKTGRPVSPHVTIYKFPVAAISSIATRVTGVFLSIGFVGIGAMSLAGGDPAALMSTIGSSPVGPVAKMVVAFPLVYHSMAGVRHLVWDRQPEKYLSNTQDVAKSSYLLLGAAAAITVASGAITI